VCGEVTNKPQHTFRRRSGTQGSASLPGDLVKLVDIRLAPINLRFDSQFSLVSSYCLRQQAAGTESPHDREAGGPAWFCSVPSSSYRGTAIVVVVVVVIVVVIVLPVGKQGPMNFCTHL